MTGLGAVGADTLLVMLGPVAVPATVPGVASDIVAVVVIGVAVVGFVAVGPTLPTGYKPMLWPFSPSAAFEETVDVPVVPDPADGCLKNSRRLVSGEIPKFLQTPTSERRQSPRASKTIRRFRSNRVCRFLALVKCSTRTRTMEESRKARI